MSVLSVASGIGGTATLDTNGDVVFTPDTDFSGQGSFTYTVTDGRGGTDTATVTVDVANVNDAPVETQVTDFGTLAEDGTVTVTMSDILANFTDADGDQLMVTNVSADSGTVMANGDGTWTFTPQADFSGAVNFTYDVTDGTVTVQGTGQLAVTSVNDAPVGVADSASGTEGTALTIAASTLLGNDTDAEGDALSLVSVASGVGGTAVLNGNGDVVFTPDADFFGDGSFTYTVSDGQGGTDTATATVVVANVNDAPVSAADTAGTSLNLPVTIAASALLGNDVDVDGDTLSLQSVTAGTGGTVSLDGNGDVQFTPDTGFVGDADFTYTTSDPSGEVSTSTVTVTVTLNAAPVAGSDVSWTQRDTATTLLASALLANDTDADGDVIRLTGVTSGAGGTVSLDGNGDVQFTPDPGFVGQASFSYTLEDINGAPSTATVRVDVTAPPVAADSMLQTSVDTSTSWSLTGSGGDGGLTYALETGAANGTVTVNADGTYDYTPSLGYQGSDTFSFRVTDVRGLTSVATVTVGVGPAEETTPSSALAWEGNAAFEFTGDDMSVSGSVDGAVRTSDQISGDFRYEWTLDSYATQSINFRAGFYDVAENGRFVSSGNGSGGMLSMTTSFQLFSSGNNMRVYHGGSMVKDLGVWGDDTTFRLERVDGVVSVYQNDVNVYTYAQTSTSDVRLVRGSGGHVPELVRDVSWTTMSGEAVAATTGNDALTGEADDDVLDGLGGDDQLSGGAGNDTLTGGAGNDTYEFARDDGQDLINNIGEGASNDKVNFGAGINTDQLWFSQSGSDLLVSIIGSEDHVSIDDWYLDAGANQVAEFKTSSGSGLIAANVENLVSAMAAFSPPAFGVTELSQTLHDNLDSVIAANWQ